MKHDSHIDESARFRGGMKHYHRKGGGPQSSWDDWIDQEATARKRRNWPKIIGFVLGAVALVGIGVALYIEMS